MANLNFDDLLPPTQAAGKPVLRPSASALGFDDLLPPQRAQVPVYDANGAPTGYMQYAPEDANAMSYGEQMRNAFGAIGRGADMVVRQAADGVTLGLADKVAAAGDALTGRAPSYDEALNAQRERTKQEADAHPIMAGVARTGGMLLPGSAALKAGVSLTPLMAGRGLLAKSALAGAEGAAWGAADAAGHTDGTLVDYARNAGQGAIGGAEIGAALPVVGKAAGLAYSLGSRLSGGVDGMSRGAATVLRSAIGRDAGAEARLQSLGPDAMLLDASPSTIGVAQGVATKPGAGKDGIVTALMDREAGANARVRGALDENLGPAPIPSRVLAGIESGQEALSPDYGRVFASASRVDTQPLADRLDTLAVDLRGESRRAVTRVRDMLNIPGTRELDPNPGSLHEVRQEIDGQLSQEANPKVIRELTAARRQVDTELQRTVPGIKEVDAQHAELARQGEGLQRGSQVLEQGKTAIRPQELADEISSGALPQGEMMGPSAVPMRIREGTRAELDRIVGTNGNDRSALQRIIGGDGDWNPEKLRILFGPERANAVLDVLAREALFQRSFADVARNSQTAQRLGGSALLDAQAPPIPTDRTLTGIGEALLRGGYRKVAGWQGDAVRDEIGQILTSTGSGRDAVLRALLDAEGRRSATASKVEDALLLRGRGPALAAGNVGQSDRR